VHPLDEEAETIFSPFQKNPGNKNQQETKALPVLATHNQSTKALY
jgi:hypothetical protein